MAALSLASIPSNINTYERLAVWAIQALQSVANGAEVNVVQGEASQPIAQAGISFTADGQFRFILSAYIPCDQNALNSSTEKTWMAAEDISAAAPHANFGSN